MVAVTTLLLGCATTTTEFVQEPIPIPARPHLPVVQPDALQCISDDAYEALAIRDTLLQEHIRLLERLLLTTH